MRRRGRACALQILYQLDLAKEMSAEGINEPAVRAAMARFWHNFESVSRDDERFAERLVLGVAREVGALDEALQQVSRNWRLGRMDKVDLNILRLAGFEMLHCADIPRSASINEAIELAKTFSGNDSAAFINGMLDQLVPDKADPPERPHLVAVADAPSDDAET